MKKENKTELAKKLLGQYQQQERDVAIAINSLLKKSDCKIIGVPQFTNDGRVVVVINVKHNKL